MSGGEVQQVGGAQPGQHHVQTGRGHALGEGAGQLRRGVPHVVGDHHRRRSALAGEPAESLAQRPGDGGGELLADDPPHVIGLDDLGQRCRGRPGHVAPHRCGRPTSGSGPGQRTGRRLAMAGSRAGQESGPDTAGPHPDATGATARISFRGIAAREGDHADRYHRSGLGGLPLGATGLPDRVRQRLQVVEIVQIRDEIAAGRTTSQPFGAVRRTACSEHRS